MSLKRPFVPKSDVKQRFTTTTTSTGLILWNIMKTAQDIYTITIKQILRLQERMYFEKNHFVKVQNGRQSAIIHFHMAVIW